MLCTAALHTTAHLDIVVNDDKGENGFHVGTYYTANGRFLGLRPWRAGRAKICNVHGSGCVGL
jgi:hypothetical protein